MPRKDLIKSVRDHAEHCAGPEPWIRPAMTLETIPLGETA